ncbi:hypothetical protein AAHC03_09351 [Spirometra sp. Aus1]
MYTTSHPAHALTLPGCSPYCCDTRRHARTDSSGVGQSHLHSNLQSRHPNCSTGKLGCQCKSGPSSIYHCLQPTSASLKMRKNANAQALVLTPLLFIPTIIILVQAVTPVESFGEPSGLATESGLFATSKSSARTHVPAVGHIGGPKLAPPLPPPPSSEHEDCDCDNPEDQPFARVSSAECQLQVECTGRVPTNSPNGGHAAKKIRIPVRAAQGPEGPRGPKGPQGPRGPPGHSPIISDAAIARRRRQLSKGDQLFPDNRRVYQYFHTLGTTTTTTTTTSSTSINGADVAKSHTGPGRTSTSTTTTTTTATPAEDHLIGAGENEVSDEVVWNLEAQNAFTDIKVLELPASLGFTDRLASLEGLLGACSIEVSQGNRSLTSTADPTYSSALFRPCASGDFVFPSVISTSVGVVIDWDSIEGTTADEIWGMFQRLLADETLFRPVRLSPVLDGLRSSQGLKAWRDADVQKTRSGMVGRYSKRAGNAVTRRASCILPILILLAPLILP